MTIKPRMRDTRTHTHTHMADELGSGCEEIMAHAEGCIRLDPTDLYHGHVFMTVDDWQGTEETPICIGQPR
eukprot:589202-Amphidinium_carterae.2